MGQRVNATFDSFAEAEAWSIRTEATILAGERNKKVAGNRPATVADLFDRYAREVSPGKRGGRWEVLRLRKLAKDEAFSGPAHEADGQVLAGFRDRQLLFKAPLSVNRELNLISAVFNTARLEWRLKIPVNPVHDIARPKNPPARTRRVSEEERLALNKICGWDGASAPGNTAAWAAWCFSFAVATAMRKGEILSLEWPHVHESHAHLPMTKNGYARDVPLSSEAVALLDLLKKGDGRVVPVGSGVLDATFRRFRDKAGLLDLHFHDSRREATTRAAAKLSNVLELAAVTGHRSLQVLKGYYAPKASDLAKKLG